MPDPAANVAQEVVEVISDSAPMTNATLVAQEAVEALSKQDRVANYSYVASQVVETLSKQARVINHSFLAQHVVEVLSKTYSRWPHNLAGVANANIQSVASVECAFFNSVMGVA